jgi:hypothetical protein
MSSRILDGRVSVHIGQLTQTKPVQIVARIGEAVHNHRMRLTVEHFTHSRVELVVRYAGPEWLLLWRGK